MLLIFGEILINYVASSFFDWFIEQAGIYELEQSVGTLYLKMIIAS